MIRCLLTIRTYIGKSKSGAQEARDKAAELQSKKEHELQRDSVIVL
jgi:hypothetical protein